MLDKMLKNKESVRLWRCRYPHAYPQIALVPRSQSGGDLRNVHFRTLLSRPMVVHGSLLGRSPTLREIRPQLPMRLACKSPTTHFRQRGERCRDG